MSRGQDRTSYWRAAEGGSLKSQSESVFYKVAAVVTSSRAGLCADSRSVPNKSNAKTLPEPEGSVRSEELGSRAPRKHTGDATYWCVRLHELLKPFNFMRNDGECSGREVRGPTKQEGGLNETVLCRAAFHFHRE